MDLKFRWTNTYFHLTGRNRRPSWGKKAFYPQRKITNSAQLKTRMWFLFRSFFEQCGLPAYGAIDGMYKNLLWTCLPDISKIDMHRVFWWYLWEILIYRMSSALLRPHSHARSTNPWGCTTWRPGWWPISCPGWNNPPEVLQKQKRRILIQPLGLLWLQVQWKFSLVASHLVEILDLVEWYGVNAPFT